MKPAAWPSLETLLRPRSVAVVGASDNPDKVGGRPLKYLQQGFAGRLYPVNPRQQTVQGIVAHARLADLPEVPDVAILCVGSEHAEEQLGACARLGIPNALLFASGYAEVGAEGLARQQRLVEICRSGGVRLLGPNGIGIASFGSGAILSFASIYTDHVPEDGPVAIVSQSGAFGVSAYALLRAAGIGVHCVAATGNEADLDSADFVAALARQAGVRLLLLYLENVKDPERMRSALEIARRAGIPVLAVRAGRSAEGKRSAHWHTGSSGAADPRLDALFDASGCRTVAHLNEMVDSVPLYLDAMAHSRCEGSAPRIAVVSNSGASCVLAADAAHRLGMPLAEPGPTSRERLDGLLPSFSLNRNPIDLTAMLLGDSSLLGKVMACVMDDAGVDAAVLGLLAIGGPSYDVARFARDARAAAMRSGRPLAVFSPHPQVREAFARAGVAVFTHEAEALAAIQGLAAHRALLHAGGLSLSASPSPEASPSPSPSPRASAMHSPTPSPTPSPAPSAARSPSPSPPPSPEPHHA
ncbi:MAG: CoA-binding protein [Rhizobacter sp.]